MSYALKIELASYRVDVCAWQAGAVRTKMTSYNKGMLVEEPDSYAEQALSRCRDGVQAGCLRHELLNTLLLGVKDILPAYTLTWAAGKLAGKNVEARKRKYGDKF